MATLYEVTTQLQELEADAHKVELAAKNVWDNAWCIEQIDPVYQSCANIILAVGNIMSDLREVLLE